MSTFLFPYKAGSVSAKELSKALGIKRIKADNSRFRGNPTKKVINWGSSTLPDEALKCQVINKPEAVAIAANKLTFFNAIKAYNQGVDTLEDYINQPLFATSRDSVESLRAIDHKLVIVERHKLTGNSGEGITVIEPDQPLSEAAPQLYVQYIPKKSEWRIHVLNGVAVDIQRKARNTEVPDEQVNWRVRNHANGFIFARNEGEAPPEGVISQAILAVQAIGLDFGAVDVIYNEKQAAAYVLEINTAPGLTGSTLEGYVKRFTEMM